MKAEARGGTRLGILTTSNSGTDHNEGTRRRIGRKMEELNRNRTPYQDEDQAQDRIQTDLPLILLPNP